MGDNLADAAFAVPLGELSRVVQACRVLFCVCFSTPTSPSVYLYPLTPSLPSPFDLILRLFDAM